MNASSAELQRHLRKIHRYSDVRLAAEALSRGEAIGPDHVSIALAALANPWSMWHVRCAAAWVLGNGSLSEVEGAAAIRQLDPLLQGRGSRAVRTLESAVYMALRTTGFVICAVVFGFLSGLLLYRDTLDIILIDAPLQVIGAIAGVAAFLCGTTALLMPFISPMLDASRRVEVRAAAADALGRLGAIKSCGLLAREAAGHDANLSFAALKALMALLPLLTEEDRLTRPMASSAISGQSAYS